MTIVSWIRKLLCCKGSNYHRLQQTTQAELPPSPKPDLPATSVNVDGRVSSFTTDVSVKVAKSFSQIWTIENFATLVEDLAPGSGLESAEFSLNSTRFTVTIYPSGSNNDNRNYMSFYITYEPKNPNLSFMCHFWAIGADNRKVIGCKFIRKFTNGIKLQNWISKADVLNPEKGYLVNGNLTIGFEVSILAYEKVKSGFEVDDSGANQILSDLWKMRHEYSDVVIEVSGGEELRAHKAILVARSPVFAAMFRHKTTRESQENRIVISDMSDQVCDAFLKYLYTGIVESLESCAADLLPIADKYQIDHLKIICEQTLCYQINSENIKQLKLLAEQHNSKVLFDKCCDFINKHTLESVKHLIENRGKAEEIEEMLIKFD